MLHITIHFLFYAPRPIAPLARYSEFLSSQIDDISPFQRPASPMQIYTITHEPPHSPLPNHVQPPPNCSISATEPLHFRHRAAPFPPQSRSISATEPLHFFYRADFYLRNRPHPPLLLTHSCKEDAPHLPTLAQYTTHAPPHISPPLPDSSSTNDPTPTHLRPPTHRLTTLNLRTFALFLPRRRGGSTMGTERLSHTNKSLLLCRPSG